MKKPLTLLLASSALLMSAITSSCMNSGEVKTKDIGHPGYNPQKQSDTSGSTMKSSGTHTKPMPASKPGTDQPKTR